MYKEFKALIGPARDITELDGDELLSTQVSEWVEENPDIMVTNVNYKVYKSLAYTMQETNITSYYYIVAAVAILQYESVDDIEPKRISLSV